LTVSQLAFWGALFRGLLVRKTLEEVRERTETLIADYNEVLPHDPLGDLTCVEYRVLHHAWH